MAKPGATAAVDCHVCGKTISRKADLGRHLRTHATNKEELMHACPYIGCPYKALQRSNLMTHLNVHSRERPNKCPEGGCGFSTSDPGSLIRHRRARHGHEPKGHSSGSHGSTGMRKAARQRRKISPYTTPSPGSSTRSGSPLDSPTPSSSILLANYHVEEGSKNNSAAYNTELITKHAQINYSHFVPNTPPENAPLLNSGLWTAAEFPAAEHLQLAAPQQGDPYAVDAVAQLVTEMTASDEVFSNFLAQFTGNEWLPEVAAAYPAPSLYTPVVQPAVDNAPLPTHTALLPFEVQPTVDNPSYEYYGYSTEAVPFGAQFPQPDQFAIPNMGVYPQVVYRQDVYRQDVDQGYLYSAGTSDFAMQVPYLY